MRKNISNEKSARENETEHGFVLLFAVIAMTIVLAITVGILNIAYKEVALATPAKDSHLAFYAADSGVECGLYYDLTAPSSLAFETNQPASVACDGSNQIGVTPVNPQAGEYDYDFLDSAYSQPGTFQVNDPVTNDNYCVKLSVRKHAPTGKYFPSPNNTIEELETYIDSYGYNVPCNAINTGQRVIQRFISAHYVENVP